MGEFIDNITGEIRGKMQELADERNFLGGLLIILEPSAPDSPPSKKRGRRKIRRGRPTDAERAARLGVSVEELKAQK